jgi:hypothetical protein
MAAREVSATRGRTLHGPGDRHRRSELGDNPPMARRRGFLTVHEPSWWEDDAARSRPALLQCGARPGLAPMEAPTPGPPFGVKGRPRAERGVETGDGAELVEATAKPVIAVASPRSDLDAGRRVLGHGHRLHRRRDRLGPAERLTKILSTREGDVRRTVRPVRVTSFGWKVTTDAVRVTVRCGRNAGRSPRR